MFQSEELKDHLSTSYTIKTGAQVFVEWNMNRPENIHKLGNYRYRPNGSDAQYVTIARTYDDNDSGNYYTGATDADIVVDAGINIENNQPELYTAPKEKMKMLYSLEDCIKPFRPRSGINKPLYLGINGSSYTSGQYVNNSSRNFGQRPRYYMSSRYDQFKYWTSYRTEDNVEYGVSAPPVNALSYIQDAAPFVVYKDEVPSNRIVVKMQTNVGDIDLGPFRVGDQEIPDPLYGPVNQTTPVRWRIQVLKGDTWQDAIAFDENSVRSDGSPIINSDGYVEIGYGLNVPIKYENNFLLVGELASEDDLPNFAPTGYAYLIKETDSDLGVIYVYSAQEWESFIPSYSWTLEPEAFSSSSKVVSNVVNPDSFIENGINVYREIDFIRGIRIVAETMNKANCTFDLIEMSPRLYVEFTNRAMSFSVSKILSDLGNSSLPVGSIFASTGTVELMNDDFALTPENAFSSTNPTGSIISEYLDSNVKFNFYEIVREVNEYDYYVPVKTLYTEGFPSSTGNFDSVSITLRDAFFILESSPAPSLFLTDVSLSYAVATLLDYIGYSNYIFKRIDGQTDPIIPYFFVAPDQNVAEVLAQLAVATQSAMFFDEYNDFVVMSKEYLLPEEGQREKDVDLLGQQEGNLLPNIINVSSQDKKVYNNGQINYTSRYIQRTYGSLQQAPYVDKYKTWIYLPALLWEVSPTQGLRTINDLASDQSAYSLSAAALNTDIPDQPPTVVGNNIINNIIDLGENVYWISKYQGYLYANGEVIKYDAMEYSVTGQAAPVWISSNQEYQKYFADLPFNGKMYPTGNLRIFAEPNYEVLDGVTRLTPGDVAAHGRGQFGTPIVAHYAGLNSYWTSNDNISGCLMQGSYLFDTSSIINYPVSLTQNAAAGVSPAKSRLSSRNSIIKNFMSNTYWTEDEVRYFDSARTGSVQSSALVFQGPTFTAEEAPRDYVSYVYKSFDQPYKHFGTRMRIVGKIESNSNSVQTPVGSSPYITVNPNNPEQKVDISGGSGGIGVMVNPQTNNGYFFEICALTTNNVNQYINSDNKEIVAYNVAPNGAVVSSNVCTVTTTVNHNFKVGEKVLLSGFNVSELNNEWIITSVTGRTFTFAIGIGNVTATSGGTAEVYIPTEMSINNVFFYKVVSDGAGNAIPYKLWSGLANIIVDDGKFVGQYRFAGEDNPTVFDLDVEFKDVGSTRTFYLYINGKQIATVVDPNPLTQYNSTALFIRGATKAMFENIFALSENISQNTTFTVADNISEVFGESEINASEALRKYAMSGFVQASYLSGISSYQPPQYSMYFEEFGTIMREAAHFNIKYDRAYPALYAKISPVLNRIKGYAVSGFYAGSYGADFLVFNCLDKTINLDSTTGNFLRIQGVTFTQNTTRTLTVDDYFKKMSNLSDPNLQGDVVLNSPLKQKEIYDKVKISRMKYGNSEFTPIDSIYIQDDDSAEEILGWITNKTINPKRNIGVNVFGLPTVQLGDIVSLDYNVDGVEPITESDKLFTVYNIEYSKDVSGTNTTLFLAEV